MPALALWASLFVVSASAQTAAVSVSCWLKTAYTMAVDATES
jgi:hypothetical protein